MDDVEIASSWVRDAGDVASVQSAQVVVAFDFDKTLTVRDTVVPYVRHLSGVRGIGKSFFANVGSNSKALVRFKRDYLKEHVLAKSLAGLPHGDAVQAAERYADHVVANWIRQDTSARLRWHQKQGHVVVLVSASFDIYLRPIAERMGLEHVLATRLAVAQDAEGVMRFTGALSGANCRGVEKVQRFREWANGQPGSLFQYAYGDSSGDTELLGAAAHGVWVQRSTLPAAP